MFQTSTQEHLSIILDFSLSFALKWHQIKQLGFLRKTPFSGHPGQLYKNLLLGSHLDCGDIVYDIACDSSFHEKLVNNNPRYARQFPKKNLPRTRFRVSSTPLLVKKNYVHFTKSVTTNNHFIYINQYLLKILFGIARNAGTFPVFNNQYIFLRIILFLHRSQSGPIDLSSRLLP